jgi:hypothetical protein
MSEIALAWDEMVARRGNEFFTTTLVWYLDGKEVYRMTISDKDIYETVGHGEVACADCLRYRQTLVGTVGKECPVCHWRLDPARLLAKT